MNIPGSLVFGGYDRSRVCGPSNLEINVPFSLLILTLTSPIVDSDTPYFPCKAYFPPSSAPEYHVGRAFRQAAFIGMNWNPIPTKWWLAQAPRPQALQSSITGIDNCSTEIPSIADASLLAESWKGIWTPFPSGDSHCTVSLSFGLSTAGIAGVAAAFDIVGLALLGVAISWLCCTGRRVPSKKKSVAPVCNTTTDYLVGKPELEA